MLKAQGRTGFKTDGRVSCVKSCLESSKLRAESIAFDYTKVIDNFGKSNVSRMAEAETGLERMEKAKSANGNCTLPYERDLVVKGNGEMWGKRNFL